MIVECWARGPWPIRSADSENFRVRHDLGKRQWSATA